MRKYSTELLNALISYSPCFTAVRIPVAARSSYNNFEPVPVRNIKLLDVSTVETTLTFFFLKAECLIDYFCTVQDVNVLSPWVQYVIVPTATRENGGDDEQPRREKIAGTMNYT